MRYLPLHLFFGLVLLTTLIFAAGNHTGHTMPMPPEEKKGKAEEARIPMKIPEQQQIRIGLKTTKVSRKLLNHTIRTVGIADADPTAQSRIQMKVNGWIEHVFADYVGKKINQGEPLFSLYSPEVLSTQEEFISAKKQGKAGKSLASGALERLKLWGISSQDLKRLERTLKPSRVVTFAAPQSGYIITKNAISGMYVTPEMDLYHIADLSKIWISVSLYEFDASSIVAGDSAEIELPYDPSFKLTGKIDYIFPQIDLQSRSAKARITVNNEALKLKPGMYANIIIQKALGESMVVPEDAVIDTGGRHLVFVKNNSLDFEPRDIKIGPRVAGEIVVLSGLKEGEEVVSSAQFLVDAESKLKAATQKMPPGHGGH